MSKGPDRASARKITYTDRDAGKTTGWAPVLRFNGKYQYVTVRTYATKLEAMTAASAWSQDQWLAGKYSDKEPQ